MKKTEKDKLSKTYGIFKFKLSTKEDQISAMSLAGESTLFKKIIGHHWEHFYDNVPIPDIGDWLMEHKEYGQTFDEFWRGGTNGMIPVQANVDTIYLAPLSCGEKGSLDSGFINSLLTMCEAFFYGMKVKLLEKRIDLMKYEIDIRQYEEGKLQINANQILKYLYREIPSDAFCLISFTDKDLYNENDIIKPRNYITKDKIQVSSSNNFCYGLSSLKNRVGVFSFARYDPLFYTNIILQDNPKQQEKLIKYFFILLKRACKVIIKETCHMFGLKNCIFFSCNLNGFNSMEEFDKRPLEICPLCLRKLYTNICMKSMQLLERQRVQNPIIVYDRFVKLRDSLAENFYGIFEAEVNWLEARIDSLKNEI